MWRHQAPDTFRGGVAVSTDGGKTWSRIKGYNFKWGYRVILDPADPEKIYITTFSGSVWHGPAAGGPRCAGGCPNTGQAGSMSSRGGLQRGRSG